MAAPTNFYQLQKQVASAIWFMDLVGAPESRKKVVATIDKEIQRVLSEKAELDLGRSFKNALAKIKNEIERSKDEAEIILANAKSKAKALTKTTDEAAAVVKTLISEVAKRQKAVGVREVETKEGAKRNAKAAADNARVKGEMDQREQAYLVLVEELRDERANLSQAASEFKQKVG